MEPSEVKFTQDYVAYKPKEQAVYPIQERDWLRLKRMIGGICPHSSIYQVLASAAFGVFASDLLSLIAFLYTPRLPAWVVPTAAAVLGASLFAGILLTIVDHQVSKDVGVSTRSILDDMDEIEDAYYKEIASEQPQPQLSENIETANLITYLINKFPDRRHASARDISQLVGELKEANYSTIGDLDIAVDSVQEAFLSYEKDYPPENSKLYADMGIIRGILSLKGQRKPLRNQEAYEKYIK